MARAARYLADWSALARAPRYAQVAGVLEPLIREHEIAACGPVLLESLASTRGYSELRLARSQNTLSFPLVPTVQADFDRAIDVMTELARRGLHRAVGAQDLLIAAVAERAGLTLLHYDSDFDHVAAVTGQPMQWVVPRGAVP